MRSIFTIAEISLADTPVNCRRGVLFVEDGPQGKRWHVIVYDPRPEAFQGAEGLELPFSAHTTEGALLIGWVCVGAGDEQVGVRSLHGLGELKIRQPWHTLPVGQRVARQAHRRQTQTDAYPDWETPMPSGTGLAQPAGTPDRRGRLHQPAWIASLSSGQRLVALAVLIAAGWGLAQFALDIGRAAYEPGPKSSPIATRAPQRAAGASPIARPLLGSNVTIIERLGFNKRYVRVRDALAITLLRNDGVAEIYALVPGGRRALADLDGECQLVMRDLLGRRTQHRALVRTFAIGDAHICLLGWVSPR
jgi:hypothetical protein